MRPLKAKKARLMMELSRRIEKLLTLMLKFQGLKQKYKLLKR